MTVELKPIDTTRYTITENGNVIRSKTVNEEFKPLSNEEKLIGSMKYCIATMMSCFTSNSDERLEPILQKLKDLGVIKSWYYNGTYHAS